MCAAKSHIALAQPLLINKLLVNVIWVPKRCRCMLTNLLLLLQYAAEALAEASNMLEGVKAFFRLPALS